MKEIISSKQSIALVIAVILDGAMVFATAAEGGRDSWISIIIAISISFILFMLYCKINTLFPEKDLYTINREAMGKILGNTINILYVWYFLHIGSLTLRDFGEFMSVLTMPEVPRITITLLSTITAVYMVKKGCEVIGRFALFASISTLIILVVLSSLLLSKVDIRKILPIMARGISPVLLGSWSAITFPFGECVLFTVIFANVNNRKALRKGYFVGLVLGGAFLLLITFLEVSVLSEKAIGFLYFPFYTLLSRIRVGEFIQRLEIIGGVILNIFGMIKISLCLYAASLGISRLLKIDNYKILCLPVGMILLNLSDILYEDVMSLVSWTIKYYKYYALPFQVFFPILIIIIVKIKKLTA
ncbi:endospore germination permease [Clostridium swellfunianum]|uniref:GerAB/ArcD/ProY family transporter n=1 Tax=Clostridium swellfunianum TaxID=1367462 RepID=UPI0020309CCA|nr:endospore germination permease [Clostridium swellfunianum]MCM0646907.1 endospore germination permease [Clostridium swellfunianum]